MASSPAHVCRIAGEGCVVFPSSGTLRVSTSPHGGARCTGGVEASLSDYAPRSGDSAGGQRTRQLRDGVVDQTGIRIG